ncbi:hypothetical protein BC629DRAFT_1734801 [Irpex lacteus]|nr:hypothetical protein BC629DRAFT_1734801 [Irpex lacteus]
MPRQTRSLARKARDLNSRGILRLPDELLAEIALLFIQSHPAVTDPFDFRNPRPISSVYGWITISHICRRWRAVVIASTRLWSTIRFTASPAWVQTLLERSGQSPLTVTEDTSTTNEKATPAKKLLLDQIERIQHLQLNVDPATCKLFTALDSRNVDAPILETLHLHCRDEGWYQCIPSIPFLPGLALPHLTHLSFHDRPDDRLNRYAPAPSLKLVQSLLRPSLTHLRIHRMKDPIFVDTCLAILRTLPNLEDLVLGDVLRVPDETPDAGMPLKDDLLELPYLRSIALECNCLRDAEENRESDEIYDTGVAAAELLRHLVIPSSADIFVAVGHELYDEANDGETLDFTFNVLKDVAGGSITTTLGPGRQAITGCYAKMYPLTEDELRNNNSFELLVDLFFNNQGSDAHERLITWPRRSSTGGSMRIRVRSDGHALGRSVHGIFTTLQPVLITVRSLCWECDFDHLKSTLAIDSGRLHGIWEGLFGTMLEVEDLVIDGAAANFVEWMVNEEDRGYYFEDVHPVLPRLRTLAIDGTKRGWSDWIHYWENPSDYARRDPRYDERADLTGLVLWMLQEWSEAHGGRKLQKLMITNTDCVSEEDMREIISSGFTSSLQCSFLESESEDDDDEDVEEDQTSEI